MSDQIQSTETESTCHCSRLETHIWDQEAESWVHLPLDRHVCKHQGRHGIPAPEEVTLAHVNQELQWLCDRINQASAANRRHVLNQIDSVLAHKGRLEKALFEGIPGIDWKEQHLIDR